MLPKQLYGKNLNYYYNQDEYRSKLNFKIPKGAPNALRKISEKYGSLPNVDGNNNKDIVEFRNFLYDLIKVEKHIAPFTIIAPHTHWDNLSPVIYKSISSHEGYIIGEHIIEDTKKYTPCTFFFCDNQIFPYEWVEQKLIHNSDEWNKSLSFLKKFDGLKLKFNKVFGIAIDFRFKESLFESPKQSVELSIKKGKLKGFSQIISRKSYNDKTEADEVEQVSWHPFSDKCYSYSKEQIKALKKYRKILGNMKSDNERENFIYELEKKLRNKSNKN